MLKLRLLASCAATTAQIVQVSFTWIYFTSLWIDLKACFLQVQSIINNKKALRGGTECWHTSSHSPERCCGFCQPRWHQLCLKLSACLNKWNDKASKGREGTSQALVCCYFQILVLLNKIKFIYVTKAVNRHMILHFNFDRAMKSHAKIARNYILTFFKMIFL